MTSTAEACLHDAVSKELQIRSHDSAETGRPDRSLFCTQISTVSIFKEIAHRDFSRLCGLFVPAACQYLSDHHLAHLPELHSGLPRLTEPPG